MIRSISSSVMPEKAVPFHAHYPAISKTRRIAELRSMFMLLSNPEKLLAFFQRPAWRALHGFGSWYTLRRKIRRKIRLEFIQRAVKPRPSGRGYKAHLSWNFLAFLPFLLHTLLGGWASRLSLWRGSETWGNGRWFVAVKFPTVGTIRKNQACSSGQSR
jgi:hypothetical protein